MNQIKVKCANARWTLSKRLLNSHGYFFYSLHELSLQLMALPLFSSIQGILFSYTNWLHIFFHHIRKSPLWSSFRPPASQVPTSASFYRYIHCPCQSGRLTSSPQHFNCSVKWRSWSYLTEEIVNIWIFVTSSSASCLSSLPLCLHHETRTLILKCLAESRINNCTLSSKNEIQ